MTRRRLTAAAFAAALFLPPLGAARAETEPRLLRLDDLYALKTVGDPQVSPDGRWVAFTVRSLEAAKDRSDTDLWMAPLAPNAQSGQNGAGTDNEAVRLTASPESETTPRWSPDGRTLAFLSGRGGKHTQVWLLDRRGGEAVRLTEYKASVADLAWSPDGKKLALVVSDVDPEEAAAGSDDKGKDDAPPKPIVVKRRQFKRDGEGFLRDIHSHVHVFDVQAKTSEQVTGGPYDDGDPAWSPDGRLIAFVSNRTADPDSNQNSDVFVVEPRKDAKPRAVTTSAGADGSPDWSPDGKTIAYVHGGDPADLWYGTNHVALAPVSDSGKAGGAVRPLTAALDRNVNEPRFSSDGRFVYFQLEDGGNQHLARIPVAGTAADTVQRVVAGERDVQDFDLGATGEIAVLETQPTVPGEVSRVAPDGTLVRVSRVNDAFLQGIRLLPVERFKAASKDGTPIDTFLVKPAGWKPGKRVPAILRIHGGPVSQFSTAFSLEWQMLAAHGYAVVAANPRGSSGYGRAFSRALWADWGNKDFEDVMAAVDGAVERGVADPERLGVGGWSYGGILTNYVITKTGRFKAATSGASEVNYLANYGHDHYQYEWETELGLPWENTDLWIRLSPWYQVHKVTTPTLILCGQEDWNVPLQNSEQLYQALRRLGRETELVIYPGQGHGITRPSFQKDRLQRYLAWYDRFVKGEKPAEAKAAAR